MARWGGGRGEQGGESGAVRAVGLRPSGGVGVMTGRCGGWWEGRWRTGGLSCLGGPQRAREGSRERDWRGLWKGGHKAAWGSGRVSV